MDDYQYIMIYREGYLSEDKCVHSKDLNEIIEFYVDVLNNPQRYKDFILMGIGKFEKLPKNENENFHNEINKLTLELSVKNILRQAKKKEERELIYKILNKEFKNLN